MKRVVLDASALMTFFHGRPGAEKVKEIILAAAEGKTELYMSVVNWGEVYYSIWRADGQEAAEKKLAEIAQLPIELVSADSGVTKLSAEFKARYKLPYADGFAAALAAQKKARLAATDSDFRLVHKDVPILWVSVAED